MSENCPYVDGCPIFEYFCRAAKTVYMNLYCQGEYQNCERYKLRQAGEPVPNNLLPHGSTLWDDGVDIQI